MDYQRARRHLMRVDPVLGALIKRVGACQLANIPALPPFMALAEAIASQQLSVKAANTIVGRFCGLFGDRIPTPAVLLTLEDANKEHGGQAIGSLNTRGTVQRSSFSFFILRPLCGP